MHSGTFWNILQHSGTFCMHSGTFWNFLHAFWNILESRCDCMQTYVFICITFIYCLVLSCTLRKIEEFVLVNCSFLQLTKSKYAADAVLWRPWGKQKKLFHLTAVKSAVDAVLWRPWGKQKKLFQLTAANWIKYCCRCSSGFWHAIFGVTSSALIMSILGRRNKYVEIDIFKKVH